MQNIVWFQILKCEDLLLSLLLYDHKQKLLLSFWKEKQFEDFIHGLGELVMVIFMGHSSIKSRE